VRDDHLTVNGVDTLELVKEFNSPLFVFSEGRIRDNIARLQRAADAVDRPIKFCYASKANSNMAILKVVLESGIDIEVNSGGELFKALRVGFRPDQIIFNGTSKSDDELDDAVRAGIYAINIDSLYEIALVEQSVERLRARRTGRARPHHAAPRSGNRHSFTSWSANCAVDLEVWHLVVRSVGGVSPRAATT
jgi:diaminopimelate decarboxylase